MRLLFSVVTVFLGAMASAHATGPDDLTIETLQKTSASYRLTFVKSAVAAGAADSYYTEASLGALAKEIYECGLFRNSMMCSGRNPVWGGSMVAGRQLQYAIREGRAGQQLLLPVHTTDGTAKVLVVVKFNSDGSQPVEAGAYGVSDPIANQIRDLSGEDVRAWDSQLMIDRYVKNPKMFAKLVDLEPVSRPREQLPKELAAADSLLRAVSLAQRYAEVSTLGVDDQARLSPAFARASALLSARRQGEEQLLSGLAASLFKAIAKMDPLSEDARRLALQMANHPGTTKDEARIRIFGVHLLAKYQAPRAEDLPSLKEHAKSWTAISSTMADVAIDNLANSVLLIARHGSANDQDELLAASKGTDFPSSLLKALYRKDGRVALSETEADFLFKIYLQEKDTYFTGQGFLSMIARLQSDRAKNFVAAQIAAKFDDHGETFDRLQKAGYFGNAQIDLMLHSAKSSDGKWNDGLIRFLQARNIAQVRALVFREMKELVRWDANAAGYIMAKYADNLTPDEEGQIRAQLKTIDLEKRAELLSYHLRSLKDRTWDEITDIYVNQVVRGDRQRMVAGQSALVGRLLNQAQARSLALKLAGEDKDLNKLKSDVVALVESTVGRKLSPAEIADIERDVRTANNYETLQVLAYALGYAKYPPEAKQWKDVRDLLVAKRAKLISAAQASRLAKYQVDDLVGAIDKALAFMK